MEWEIFEIEGVSKCAKIERGKIKVLEEWREKKVGVRAIDNGKVGFVTANHFTEDLIEKAKKIAKISEEKMERLPEGEFVKVEGIYDKRVENVTSDKIKEFVESMVNSALNYNVNPSNGIIELSVETIRLKNSFGADLEHKSTYCQAYLECVCDGSSGFEIDESRGLVDFEFVGRRSAELAVESRNPEKIEGIYNLVLSPIAVHQLLEFTLYPAISLENVLKGRSPLTEVGKNYLGKLSVVDDGTLPNGLCTAPFDDEGVGVKENVIFDEGMLKSHITDFRHSLIAKVEPTGNGFRGDDLYPATAPTNVILEFDEVEKELVGIYVHSLIGAHTSNPVSGDFSLETMNAFLDGKPVRAMIYGNVYDLLKKITAFGKDVRQIENTVTPSIEFESIKFV
ncbi:TldD/PmbA family protein [Archaeoglobus sp.]